MDFEGLSHEELLKALQSLLQMREAAGTASDRERLLHELQVHQIELEMQNRELREAQHALEESRNRYADLYDFAPAAYFTLDANAVVLELNLAAAALIGRERHNAVGLPLLRAIAFEDQRTFLRHLASCLDSQTPVVGEFRMLVRGRHVDVQASSVPAVALASATRTVRMALTDITPRKHAEAELEAALDSERRLRGLLEALDRAHIEAAGALTSGASSMLVQVMRVIVRHARSLVSARWAGLELDRDSSQLDPLAAEPMEDGGQRASERGGPRIELRLAYGERVLGRLSVARAALDAPFSGEERRALNMLVERLSGSLEIARLHAIDARDKLRLSLLERVASRLRNVQEVTAAEAAMADIAAAVVPDFADLCLVYLVQHEQLSLHCVRHRDLGRQQLLAARLREPETQRGLQQRLRELAPSHEPRLLRRTACDPGATPGTPLDDLLKELQAEALIVAPLRARGALLGVVCYGRLGGADAYDPAMLAWAQEISARCASALDLSGLLHELREAVEWRDNLMAMISHDLRSPLSAIALSANALVPEQPQRERRSSHKQIDLIRRSADHMHHLIDDLLSDNLLEAGSLRVELRRERAFELAEEACQLAEPLLKSRSIELERAFVEDLPCVFADREAIQRVFSNLLGNAAKFTPAQGRVRVAVSHGDTSVVFCVSDSGPGIPEEQQGRLFERYWKGRRGGPGLGLGLYISKAIVQAHDGRIWLESGAPGGATFCFELPRCDPAH